MGIEREKVGMSGMDDGCFVAGFFHYPSDQIDRKFPYFRFKLSCLPSDFTLGGRFSLLLRGLCSGTRQCFETLIHVSPVFYSGGYFCKWLTGAILIQRFFRNQIRLPNVNSILCPSARSRVRYLCKQPRTMICRLRTHTQPILDPVDIHTDLLLFVLVFQNLSIWQCGMSRNWIVHSDYFQRFSLTTRSTISTLHRREGRL